MPPRVNPPKVGDGRLGLRYTPRISIADVASGVSETDGTPSVTYPAKEFTGQSTKKMPVKQKWASALPAHLENMVG